jgi:hypothetical protein
MADKLTNMMLSESELQCRLIYAIIVAGKSARFAENAIRKLFSEHDESPFKLIRTWWDRHTLESHLRMAKTGNYGKLVKALPALAWSDIDLRTCTPADLEIVHGIGPKTSRFFILWTRPDARYAALDVHILRWLGKKGYKVPKNTPQSTKAYAVLEKAFLDEAEKLGLSPAELDKQVWMAGAKWDSWNPNNFISDK